RGRRRDRVHAPRRIRSLVGTREGVRAIDLELGDAIDAMHEVVEGVDRPATIRTAVWRRAGRHLDRGAECAEADLRRVEDPCPRAAHAVERLGVTRLADLADLLRLGLGDCRTGLTVARNRTRQRGVVLVDLLAALAEDLVLGGEELGGLLADRHLALDEVG